MSCTLRTSRQQSYYVIFTQQHSGAGELCRLLNRHPELSCSGEVFHPHHKEADAARRSAGFTRTSQSADPVRFLRAHFAQCETRACGIEVLPNQYPGGSLSALFPQGCGVQRITLERANVSAAYAAFRHAVERAELAEHSDGRLGASNSSPRVKWRDMSFDRYARLHRSWFSQVSKVAPKARAYRLALEDLERKPPAKLVRHLDRQLSTPPSPPPPPLQSNGRCSALGAPGAGPPHREAVLCDIYRLLDVRDEDQLCLFDRCVTTWLASAPSYRQVHEATSGVHWDAGRLSTTVSKMRAIATALPSIAAPASSGPAAGTVTKPLSIEAARAGASRGAAANAFGSGWSGDAGAQLLGGHALARERQRQAAVAMVAGAAFSTVIIGGFCLSLGVALGQRYALARRREERGAAGSGRAPTTPRGCGARAALLAPTPYS